MKRYLIIFSIACFALFAESSYSEQGLIIEKPGMVYDNTLNIDKYQGRTTKSFDDIFVPAGF